MGAFFNARARIQYKSVKQFFRVMALGTFGEEGLDNNEYGRGLGVYDAKQYPKFAELSNWEFFTELLAKRKILYALVNWFKIAEFLLNVVVGTLDQLILLLRQDKNNWHEDVIPAEGWRNYLCIFLRFVILTIPNFLTECIACLASPYDKIVRPIGNYLNKVADLPLSEIGNAKLHWEMLVFTLGVAFALTALMSVIIVLTGGTLPAALGFFGLIYAAVPTVAGWLSFMGATAATIIAQIIMGSTTIVVAAACTLKLTEGLSEGVVNFYKDVKYGVRGLIDADPDALVGYDYRVKLLNKGLRNNIQIADKEGSLSPALLAYIINTETPESPFDIFGSNKTISHNLFGTQLPLVLRSDPQYGIDPSLSPWKFFAANGNEGSLLLTDSKQSEWRLVIPTQSSGVELEFFMYNRKEDQVILTTSDKSRWFLASAKPMAPNSLCELTLCGFNNETKLRVLANSDQSRWFILQEKDEVISLTECTSLAAEYSQKGWRVLKPRYTNNQSEFFIYEEQRGTFSLNVCTGYPCSGNLGWYVVKNNDESQWFMIQRRDYPYKMQLVNDQRNETNRTIILQTVGQRVLHSYQVSFDAHVNTCQIQSIPNGLDSDAKHVPATVVANDSDDVDEGEFDSSLGSAGGGYGSIGTDVHRSGSAGGAVGIDIKVATPVAPGSAAAAGAHGVMSNPTKYAALRAGTSSADHSPIMHADNASTGSGGSGGERVPMDDLSLGKPAATTTPLLASRASD